MNIIAAARLRTKPTALGGFLGTPQGRDALIEIWLEIFGSLLNDHRYSHDQIQIGLND